MKNKNIIKDPFYIPPDWISKEYYYQESWHRIKIAIDCLDLFWCLIKQYWYFGIVLGITFYLYWLFINSQTNGLMSGDFIWLVLAFLIPIVFGLGMKHSRKYCT